MAGNAGKAGPMGSRSRVTVETLAPMEVGKTRCAFALEIMNVETKPIELRLTRRGLPLPICTRDPSPNRVSQLSICRRNSIRLKPWRRTCATDEQLIDFYKWSKSVLSPKARPLLTGLARAFAEGNKTQSALHR